MATNHGKAREIFREKLSEEEARQFGEEIRALALKYKCDAILGIIFRGETATNIFEIPGSISRLHLKETLSGVIRVVDGDFRGMNCMKNENYGGEA